MRVFVESDMTVCPDGHTLTLHAGEAVEGPLARYLVTSDCDVTVEEDDQEPTASEPAGGNPKEARPPAEVDPSQADAPDVDLAELSGGNDPQDVAEDATAEPDQEKKA